MGSTSATKKVQVQKCYVAVVHGHPPEKGHITEALRLVQLGGGTKYRAFVDESGKAGTGKMLGPERNDYQQPR